MTVDFSNDNESFLLLCRFFFYSVTDILFYRTWLYIERRVSHRKQELLTICVHLGSTHRFFTTSVLLICLAFHVLCFCFLFLSMFCVLYPYLPVPLNGPILISTWLFLLAYILKMKINNMKMFWTRMNNIVCFLTIWTCLLRVSQI